MLKNKEEETIFMKKKFVIYFCILALLILGVIFASSQVQALSKQRGLGRNQELREEARNNRRESSQICINEQEIMRDCNICNQNEYCQIHERNIDCANRYNQCLPKTHNCRRNCNR